MLLLHLENLEVQFIRGYLFLEIKQIIGALHIFSSPLLINHHQYLDNHISCGVAYYDVLFFIYHQCRAGR